MEFLGVGPEELVFILLIALILLGPKDMMEAGRTLGKTLRKIVTSPTWKTLRSTGQELQKLPTRLMREAGIDELKEMEKELRDSARVSIDPRLVSRSLDEGKAPAEVNPAPASDAPAPTAAADGQPPATPPSTPQDPQD